MRQEQHMPSWGTASEGAASVRGEISWPASESIDVGAGEEEWRKQLGEGRK